MANQFNPESFPFSEIKQFELFTFSTYRDLFSLLIIDEVTGEGTEGDMANGSIGVSKGEVSPIAVKVIPASADYRDFTINAEDTRAVVMNSIGAPVDTYGEISVDNENQTVVFGWDTSEYDIGSYTIVIWVSITYNGASYLMKSNTISKSIKKTSLLS